MKRPVIRNYKQGKEKLAQKQFRDYLESLGWVAKMTHGNLFSKGWPDTYATHAKHGTRWIEHKLPGKWSFTGSQKKEFPMLWENGTKIWVVFMDPGTDCAPHYRTLFQPPNFGNVWTEYQNRRRKK